jgi:hypothetical protein
MGKGKVSEEALSNMELAVKLSNMDMELAVKLSNMELAV